MLAPTATITNASRARAAAAPHRLERQPRVRPIASTIVSASTNSTAEARNDATAMPKLERLKYPPPRDRMLPHRRGTRRTDLRRSQPGGARRLLGLRHGSRALPDPARRPRSGADR